MTDDSTISVADVDAPDEWIVEEDGSRAVYVYHSRDLNESQASLEASNHHGNGWSASLYLPPADGGLHDLVDSKEYSSPQEAATAVSRVATAFDEGRLSREDCLTTDNVFEEVSDDNEE